MMPSRILPALVASLVIAAPSSSAAQNVTEIQMAPPQATIKVGERMGLAATAFDRVGNVIPTARFRWSSSNPDVVRVDNNGTVTGVAAGVAIVEARSGSRKGAAAVQVVGAPAAAPAPVQSQPAKPPEPVATDQLAGQPPGAGPAAALRIDPSAVYLLPSENVRVAARALREDGGAAAPVPLTWTSLVPAIASVDPRGTVVALTPGQGTIQVSGPGGLTATAPVVVQQADLVIKEQGPLLLSPGEPDTLHVVVPSQNGREVSPLGLTWSSSDTGVVRVGLTGVLTPAGPGKATVTAAGLLQSRAIEIAVHRPVEILVARPRAAAEILLPLSSSARFQVEALAADNVAVPEAPIRWSLADTVVASFDAATGTLSGRSIGKTVLTARAPGQGLAVAWTVSVAAGEVRVAPARVGLAPGRRATLAATFVGEGGAALGPAPVTWSSEDVAVAAVGADGVLSAVGWGRTRAVATAPGGKTAAADVFVLGEIVVASSRTGRFQLHAAQRDDLSDLRRIGTDTLDAVEPAFSADGSRVAVVSTRDGNAEIYAMDADGTNLVRLTNDPAADGGPAFTPDGRTVVFHSDRAGRRPQVFAVDAAGGNLRQLTQDSTNSQPAVSPDGGTIAFVSTRERNYDVWLMSRDGTNQRKFTSSPQWNERHPRFLRDGSLALLVERREGGRTVTQVMRADIATGALTSLSGTDLAISDFAVSPAGDLLALVVVPPGQERARTVPYQVVLVPVGGGTGTPVALPSVPGERMITPAFVP